MADNGDPLGPAPAPPADAAPLHPTLSLTSSEFQAFTLVTPQLAVGQPERVNTFLQRVTTAIEAIQRGRADKFNDAHPDEDPLEHMDFALTDHLRAALLRSKLPAQMEITDRDFLSFTDLVLAIAAVTGAGHAMRAQAVRNRFDYCTQKPHETCAAYALRFMSAAQALNLNPNHHLETFANGLALEDTLELARSLVQAAMLWNPDAEEPLELFQLADSLDHGHDWATQPRGHTPRSRRPPVASRDHTPRPERPSATAPPRRSVPRGTVADLPTAGERFCAYHGTSGHDSRDCTKIREARERDRAIRPEGTSSTYRSRAPPGSTASAASSHLGN